MANPKFQVGQQVRIVRAGSGIGSDGAGQIVTLTANDGVYTGDSRVGDQVGYKYNHKPDYDFSSNCCSGAYGGYVGEVSFAEIVEDETSVNMEDD